MVLMGEAKRRKLAEVLSGALTDEGKIIEAGWRGLKSMAIAPDAPQIQLDEMRMAFFAGAQHLFASILTVLDPGEGITDRDLKRMDRISEELAAFSAEFEARHLPTDGSA